MKTLLIAFAGILSVAPMAVARQRLEPAQVIIVRPHSHHVPAYTYYGPGYYSYGPRYYTEVPATTLYSDSRFGEVEVQTHFKEAMVYIDGGLAGNVHKLDEFKLTPGTHEIEVRSPSGLTLYHEVINVLPGKTTKIKF